MALVACPDCGREVSDSAPACPGCGRPMRAAAPPEQPVNPQWQPNGQPRVWVDGGTVRALPQTGCVTSGCAWIAGLFFLLVVIGAFAKACR